MNSKKADVLFILCVKRTVVFSAGYSHLISNNYQYLYLFQQETLLVEGLPSFLEVNDMNCNQRLVSAITLTQVCLRKNLSRRWNIELYPQEGKILHIPDYLTKNYHYKKTLKYSVVTICQCVHACWYIKIHRQWIKRDLELQCYTWILDLVKGTTTTSFVLRSLSLYQAIAFQRHTLTI